MVKEESFKLPIDFLTEKKYKLSPNILTDLDHINTKNDISLNPFSKILKSSNSSYLNEILFDRMINEYTTDTKYLSNFQKQIYDFSIIKLDENIYKNFITDLNKYKNVKNMHEHYEFIEWKQLEFLNKDSTFLQCMAYYTVASPILSIVVPILFLLMPFFLINIGTKISFSVYKDILFKQLKNHAIGKVFNVFDNSMSIDKKIMSLVPVFFFIFSTYQNISSTIRFYFKTNEICKFVYDTKNILVNTLNNCDILDKLSADHISFQLFSNYIREKREKVFQILNTFPDDFSPFLSTNSILNIGIIKTIFYDILNSNDFNSIIQFSNSIAGYISNLNSIKLLTSKKDISKCKYHNKSNNKISNQYFVDKSFVKNNIHLNRNFIITGPNASGKTTLLKSTLVNIILSQQFGFGFYSKCKLNPYNYIYSYINIPDTSGRDSLFQAESKRCLSILNNIKNSHKKSKHFIIFDELYSGTNPYEASVAGKTFLNYITQNKNVTFMLTTHFDDLNQINNSDNFNMSCKLLNKQIIYSYKLVKGKSKIKGAFNVLENLGYPNDLIDQLYKNI
jgi:hypothetical protein